MNSDRAIFTAMKKKKPTSMAQGIVKATSRIAGDLVHYLTRIYGGEIAETK